MRGALLAYVLLGGVLLGGTAGCVAPAQAKPASAGTAAVPTAAPTTTIVTRALPTPTPAVARPDKIRVELYEWSIATDPLEFPPGTYTVEVVNMGEKVHALTVTGAGGEEQTRRLKPGQSATLEVTFSGGEYDFWCPIGDHRDYGMMDFVTVIEDAAPQAYHSALDCCRLLLNSDVPYFEEFDNRPR